MRASASGTTKTHRNALPSSTQREALSLTVLALKDDRKWQSPFSFRWTPTCPFRVAPGGPFQASPAGLRIRSVGRAGLEPATDGL